MKIKVFQILLIEDNQLDARLVEEYLSELEGRSYQISHTSTLHEGLSLLVSQKFDLIISDLGLPDSQGIETYRAIYELKPQCPILILTGFEDEEVAKGALREGAQDYITKNHINSEILQKAIDYSIERAAYFKISKQSQEQFKVAVEGANDGIWDWEITTNKVFLSPQWKRMIGYEDHELKNEFSTFESFLHPDDKDRVLNYVNDYLSGKIKEYKLDFRFRHKKGHYLWIMSRGAALKNKDGELYRMAGSHTDITERVKFKEYIEEQNKFLHNIIESISYPFFVVDIKNFKIELLNSAVSPGITKYGMKCYELVFNGQNKCPKFNNMCPVTQIIDTKKEVIFEQERKDEDGSAKFIEVHAFPILNSKGEVTKMIEYHIDITQRKLQHIELENYRKDLEKKVSERTRQLNESLKKERELNELKSGFVSLTSHQFRTPLSTIQSSVELLDLYNEKINPHDKAKINKHIGRINEELKRMNQTMDDVLLLGKIEAGKTPFKPERTDLVKFCQSIIHQHYLSDIDTREVLFNYTGEPYDINIDQKLMHHIVTNLLSNALKYSEGNPQLSIDFQQGKYIIMVKDTGIGIPEKDKKNLFQSFSRGSNTAGIQGTGLGLVIVKQFVELHGGTIFFNSKENEGTEFIITCPVV